MSGQMTTLFSLYNVTKNKKTPTKVSFIILSSPTFQKSLPHLLQ